MMKARKPPEKLWTSITVPSHTHLFRCTGVQVYRCQVYRCAGVQVYRFTGVKVYRCQVQVHRSPTHLLQVSR